MAFIYGPPHNKISGSKGQTISFSESSHVAYQIKADDAGSNMVVIRVSDGKCKGTDQATPL